MLCQSIKPDKAYHLGDRCYADSKVWQCRAGGAHFWILIEGATWQCRKCGDTREFHCPDYVWNDRMDRLTFFGVSGLYDAMQRSPL